MAQGQWCARRIDEREWADCVRDLFRRDASPEGWESSPESLAPVLGAKRTGTRRTGCPVQQGIISALVVGASSSGKTRVFGTRTRRFESSRPSHFFRGINIVWWWLYEVPPEECSPGKNSRGSPRSRSGGGLAWHGRRWRGYCRDHAECIYAVI